MLIDNEFKYLHQFHCSYIFPKPHQRILLADEIYSKLENRLPNVLVDFERGNKRFLERINEMQESNYPEVLINSVKVFEGKVLYIEASSNIHPYKIWTNFWEDSLDFVIEPSLNIEILIKLLKETSYSLDYLYSISFNIDPLFISTYPKINEKFSDCQEDVFELEVMEFEFWETYLTKQLLFWFKKNKRSDIDDPRVFVFEVISFIKALGDVEFVKLNRLNKYQSDSILIEHGDWRTIINGLEKDFGKL